MGRLPKNLFEEVSLKVIFTVRMSEWQRTEFAYSTRRIPMAVFVWSLSKAESFCRECGYGKRF